jgi:recombination protein RecT
VISAASKNPLLFECDRNTLIKAVADIVSMGLEPGGPLGEAYLVPYKNKGKWECRGDIGYRGYIAMLRRSGQLKSICANVVYKNDTFKINLADDNYPLHEPCMTGDRGLFIGVYCVVTFKDGGIFKDFMTKHDVDKIRSISPSGNSDYGPWVKFYDEMAKKSVVKRSSKYFGLSTEDLSRVEEVESSVVNAEHGLAIVDMPEMADSDFDGNTGEVVEASATESVLNKLRNTSV